MNQKENDKNDGVKNIKEKAKGVHIQKHKSNYPYTKHNDKELNAPLFHMPNTN